MANVKVLIQAIHGAHKNEPIQIVSQQHLKGFLKSLPNGTTVDVLASDLEAGNFDMARFEMPYRFLFWKRTTAFQVAYTGE